MVEIRGVRCGQVSSQRECIVPMLEELVEVAQSAITSSNSHRLSQRCTNTDVSTWLTLRLPRSILGTIAGDLDLVPSLTSGDGV